MCRSRPKLGRDSCVPLYSGDLKLGAEVETSGPVGKEMLMPPPSWYITFSSSSS